MIDLKEKYHDEWRILHEKLKTIKIGGELYTARKNLTAIQAQIDKLNIHIGKIRKALTEEVEVTLL